MIVTKAFAGISAFACGVVVAIVMLVARQDLSAAPTIRIHTCAAADGTLRLTEPNQPCAPEERSVRINVPGAKDPDCKPDEARVQKLENHLKDLEYRDRIGTLRGRRVKAPFEVVTKDNGRLLRIEEQSATFYNRNRQPVVWIVADASGGMLQAQTADGNREVTIAAQDARSHLLVKEAGVDRIDLGRRANGRYGVQVSNAAGKAVVGFGQSVAGSGLLLVSDAAGTPKVAMKINKLGEGGTQVTVANAGGTEVASMSAIAGGGQLHIGDSSGNSKVEAGLTQANVGVVRTFPGNCHSGVGIVGVVPDCIVGKR